MLPLQKCLANTTCFLAAQLYQSAPEGLACRVTTHYVDASTEHEDAEIERIFYLIDKAATDRNVTWWLTTRSATGAVLHHYRLPWDDDFDFYILDGDIPKLQEEHEQYNITVLLTMVLQFHNASMIVLGGDIAGLTVNELPLFRVDFLSDSGQKMVSCLEQLLLETRSIALVVAMSTSPEC